MQESHCLLDSLNACVVAGIARLLNLARQFAGWLLPFAEGSSVCDVSRIAQTHASGHLEALLNTFRCHPGVGR